MSIFDELRAHAELDAESAHMLPLGAYTSDDVLDVELRELFGRDWLCVARTIDVPRPGDYVTAEIPSTSGGQRSLIVIRDDGGEIHAFDNVCVHRGARLLDGCGSAARITCPYHAWTYRSDGSLIGSPHMGSAIEATGTPFDVDRHRLGTLRAETWEGFVFVAQDPEAAPLAPMIAGLHDVVARYDMSRYVPVHEQIDVWETNWKLLVENFMDAYHVFKVHQHSFGATGDNTADTVVVPGTDHWTHHRVLDSGAALAHRSNDRLADDWRRTIVLAAIFPGFVVQLQPDWMWHLRITPLGTGRVRIAWQVAVAPEFLADQPDVDEYIGELMALIHLVNSEDQPIVEGVRRNVERPQFERAPWSTLERNVYDVDRYVSRRLTS